MALLGAITHMWLACKKCGEQMVGIVSYEVRELCRHCGGEILTGSSADTLEQRRKRRAKTKKQKE